MALTRERNEAGCGARLSRALPGLRMGAAALCLGLSLTGLSEATEEPSPAPSAVTGTGVDDAVRTASLQPPRSVLLERQRERTIEKLAAISSNAGLTKEALAALDAEIETLRSDRETIREAMVEAALRQKETSAALSAIEGRIGELSAEEGTLKASFVERRALLANVLAALQRMGREPPPALLVRPEDALGSVRSAILLGSVVPSLREETRTLLADMERLRVVRSDLAGQMEDFGSELLKHRSEEERLKRLSARKDVLERDNLAKREEARLRAEALAGDAEDLKDLITALDRDVKAAQAIEEAERVAAEEAREETARLERERAEAEAQAQVERERAEELARLAATAAEEEKARLAEAEAAADTPAEAVAEAETETETQSETAAAPDAPAEVQVAMIDPQASGPAANGPAASYDLEALRRSVRFLEPSAPFSTLKKRLNPPVAGRQTIDFEERDDIGRASTGVTFAARSGDVVTAPADAKVLYSGPFRSYGEVLILDAGDGYHIVLAGMDRIDVETGQFVSAGEPIAAMGSRRLASADAADFGTGGSNLYVEFRKNGTPVDPSAWWTD
ncbi:hypothetical protein DYI37_17495 [Fulvimarina endophytica]|uniref:M23ase beta-sheet core domain-containing protein n=1 Tax=Fulvimarina endophytica TaxID=2293836 RepID=A0A371WYH1_9HYPH|nr:peptidoglycan DD-metalloendopeptidase family protein [Fulvimarina endophytica]RFC62045.1 hypothetical protein DYI37_17495 [Fulvimarina endophytica]